MTSKEVRGSEFYDNGAVRASYLRHRHDGRRSPNRVMEEPAFLAAVGPLDGRRVLDLGCGDGSTARTLLAAGAASYVGVDGSAGMIEAAHTHHGISGARFIHRDIEDVEIDVGEFDLVVSRMALHYINRLEPVLETVHRALPVGGKLVFSVVHPVITSHDMSGDDPRTTWTVDNYFNRGPRERPWFGSTVTWYHRTIENYVRLVTELGFRLETVSECEPQPELLADYPDELARRRRVPLILVIAAGRHE